MKIPETIESFRRGALDIDCKSMALTRRGERSARYRGPGYLRQAADGALLFKVYAAKGQRSALEAFQERLSGVPGQVYRDEALYDLVAIEQDGTIWKASHILPSANWNMANRSVIVVGAMSSMLAVLPYPQRHHYLRLHFFEEYEVPLHLSTKTEERGIASQVVDRAQFNACGASFEVQTRNGWGDTVVEVTSEHRFPRAFNLRIQEALQFITGKSAFYRARVQNVSDKLALELASPTRKSARTQFDPPISPMSIEWRRHTWNLFERYLAYLVKTTRGTHWNPVAYHLYNACEATGGSVDAWALGLSVAVEALVSITNPRRKTKKKRKAEPSSLEQFQARMLEWLAAQKDFTPLHERVRNLIESLTKTRPQDTLHELAASGYVEKAYIKDWSYLRNRHAHPNIKDLKKSDPLENQRLLDRLHRVEVVLRQLAFSLIGYQGPFTDYGSHGFPPKQYPLGEPPEVPGPASTS